MAASANWKPLLTNDCPIQPLALFILKKRKTMVALALATAATGLVAPQARADMTKCWVSLNRGEDLERFECDHTLVKDRQGVVWHQLVYKHNRKGIRVALYKDGGELDHAIMTHLDGTGRTRTEAWIDDDGDFRIRLDGTGRQIFAFAWRRSRNPQIASLRPGSGIRTVSRTTTRRNVEIEELLQGL